MNFGWLRTLSKSSTGVSPQRAQELAGAGYLIVDVRESFEWNSGHAPGATSAPLSSLKAASDRLPKDRKLVVMCQSGHRSAVATARLSKAGFEAVNLEGGMRAWKRAGLPVTKAN